MLQMKQHLMKQGGVALISVLLVVAVATIMTVAMAREQMLTIHKFRNYKDQKQAYLYALGGEELARQLLHDDYVSDNRVGRDKAGEVKRDTLLDTWALGVQSFEYENGSVEVEIVDLQSRFNLNSLASKGKKGGLNRQRFAVLLNRLAIDPAVTDLVIDWIDQDQTARQLGAEDYEYLVSDPPYRTAGRLLSDVSELRLLLNMTADVYDQLLPHVTVLPTAASDININTAGEIVLQSIAPDLSFQTTLAIMEIRDEAGGFDSVAAFLQQEGVTGARGIDPAGLSIDSQFFQVNVQARYNERVSYLTSVVQRDFLDGSIRVIGRDLGQKNIYATRLVEAGEGTEAQ